MLKSKKVKKMIRREQGDSIKGGKADKKKPSAFNKKQIQIGTKVEREHTSSNLKAREIAMDHLTEIPDYYTRLLKMEREAKKELKAKKKK